MEDPFTASCKSCVKVYLCSNPEDSVLERKNLREIVFPRVREHCRHSHGLDFRVIDPYENSDPRTWPDQRTRHNLVQECREVSAGPYLVALVGKEYGAVCLPAQVEEAEFHTLLEGCQAAGISTLAVQRSYLRDENAVPPSFCLQQLSHGNTQLHPEKQTDEKTREPNVIEENEIRKVLQAAVSQCVQGGLLIPERAQKYFRSALDTDLRFALENRPRHDIDKRCLVYINRISSGQGQFEVTDQSPLKISPHPHSPAKALSNDSFLSQLCDDFLPSLVTSCRLQVYTTISECEPHSGYTPARRRSYAEGLCQQLYSDVMALIDSSLISGSASSPCAHDVSEGAQAEQKELCSIYSRLYEVSRNEEGVVKAYLEQKDTQCPLVIRGGPCTGKTVLLAHCAEQVKRWLSDVDPVLIIHFSSLSVNSSPRWRLSRLCHLIAHEYNHSPYPEPNTSLSQLREYLSSLLFFCPTPNRPLVFILDGLEQGSTVSGSRIIQCLPSPVPPNVKLILSVSPTQLDTIDVLKCHYPQSSTADIPGSRVFVDLGPVERRCCVRMLASLLEQSGRKVTSGQQRMLNLALSSCPLTLYARLLHTHALLWTSGSEITETTLPVGVHPSIMMFLGHLEKKHGLVLVSRALSYLTISKTGLTETELSDLLSSDNKVLAGYIPAGGPCPFRVRVPEVDMERLLLDLKGFLVKRTVTGSQVLCWLSRHFGLVVVKRYLSISERREELHLQMADYFNGRWCYGTSKPLVISHSTGTKQSGAVSDPAQVEMHVDRQPCGQPYVFISEPSSCFYSSTERVRVNQRKLLELPYHLRESGRWEELVRGLMMSLEFHQAMLSACLLEDLVSLLEGGEGEGRCRLVFPRERALLACMLREAVCLWSSPTELPTVTQVRLLPFLGVFPELDGYAEEVAQTIWTRGSGLGVLLSPAPSSVPSRQCSLPEARQFPVTTAAGTACETVVVTRSDGSVWLWRGAEAQQLKLSCKTEVKFESGHCSGSCILVSTRCNRLLLWDVNGTECFREIQTAEERQVKGFLLRGDRMCVWWKGLSYISVGEVSTSLLLTQLHCEHTVRSVTFPSSGQFVYCGQEKGTVSVFDLSGGFLAATCSSPTEFAVICTVLGEDEEELTCVDLRGNIFCWEIAAKTAPRLLKECCSDSSHIEVANTDLHERNGFLLLCKTHAILLWDIRHREWCDHFRAPCGKAFSQALLAEDGHLILASLKAFPAVLVWKIDTGQCVLSLETGDQCLSLLKTASALSAVAQNGRLTRWDSKVMYASAMVPKMGSGLRQVVVEPTGERFYTTDGSETLWRWSLQTGSPEAYFLHDKPVEKLCLSPDGSRLVSLSGGDIYVWQSDTGLNLHRVRGGRATEILVTRNGRLAVCVSRAGPSKVWNLASGSVVCNVHLYLADAQVSSENTFLLGLCHGDLLAVSLWSGTVSKRFSCSERYECSAVLAFRTLLQYPDFAIVIAASGSVYTWRVTQETVCLQFLLPDALLCQPRVFRTSADGSFALVSVIEDVINLLDLSRARLCKVRAAGPVLKVCLEDSGRYAVYVCRPAAQANGCECDLHTKPALVVVRLADGGQVAKLSLGKSPTALASSGGLCVYVGFQDGSVGVYSIYDIAGGGAVRGRTDGIGRATPCQCDCEPVQWFPLGTPSITWAESSLETTEQIYTT
ncbi:hypothetical protein DPEC_G00243440 [Dallia pectoralis]|uniref:Uncharacterized protein n=1 Tax=Dallia pectoralis TaxID=75939 RepID=A0ACC2FVI7_DALPE|nr:hypothetical protein DPEC_G00243440 [Dallia pectoralis]